MSVCPSVRPFVCPSVRQSTTYAWREVVDMYYLNCLTWGFAMMSFGEKDFGMHDADRRCMTTGAFSFGMIMPQILGPILA